MRALPGVIVLLVVVLSPSLAHAEDCPAPSVCATGDALNAAADGLCRRARAAEERLQGKVLPDLAAAQAQRDVCHGRLAQLTEHPPAPPAPWRSPWWLRIPIDVALVGVGTGVGVVAGIGAPPEVIVGGVVIELALLVGRLVLEALD